MKEMRMMRLENKITNLLGPALTYIDGPSSLFHADRAFLHQFSSYQERGEEKKK
jgi:hypothetical protein